MIKIYAATGNKKKEHNLSKALAEFALADTFNLRLPLKHNDKGKPYFEYEGIYVSISHSEGICFAAISDKQIGIDIEAFDRKTSSKSSHYVKLAERFFTAKEAEYIKESPAMRFLEVWCAKESYMKYMGEGFLMPMSSFCIFDTALCISSVDFKGGHLSVCSEEKLTSPIIYCKAPDKQKGEIYADTIYKTE